MTRPSALPGRRCFFATAIALLLWAAGGFSIYGAPRFNPLDAAWAKYIQKNPGGQSDSSRHSYYIAKSKQLHASGYNLYKQKNDEAAILEYKMALRYHATGRLYYDYGNSLSNIPRLQDAVKAYLLAVETGFANPHLALFNTACAYSRLRDRANSFKYLKEAVSRGYTWLNYITSDSDLSYLRSGPDWPAQYKQLQAVLDRALHGKPGFRNVRWGMIPWSVISAETGKPVREGFYLGAYTLWYRENFLGKPVLLRYRFDNKWYKLQYAAWSFVNLELSDGSWKGFLYRNGYTAATAAIQNPATFLAQQYTLLRSKLTAKYGTPAEDNPPQNGSGSTVWITDDHKITLKAALTGKSADLSVFVSPKKLTVAMLY